MASLISIRRRPRDVASLFSLFSRATTYTPIRECTISRTALPSTRQFGTSPPNPGHSSRISQFRTILTQQYLQQPIFVPTIRWNSSNSSTPTFRQWGFEDINASLSSDSPSSPSSSPQKRLIIVDVREPAELNATGIIPSAIAMPLASQPDALFLTPDEFETRFGYPKPGTEEGGADIVFYCKAGVRARAAAQLAVQAGYDAKRIGVYEGSWLDWAKNRGRVERWEGEGYE